jgi:hypothetical protein
MFLLKHRNVCNRKRKKLARKIDARVILNYIMSSSLIRFAKAGKCCINYADAGNPVFEAAYAFS